MEVFTPRSKLTRKYFFTYLISFTKRLLTIAIEHTEGSCGFGKNITRNKKKKRKIGTSHFLQMFDSESLKSRFKDKRTSVYVCNNADMIADLADFYIPDKAVVADVTYGRGAFWRKTDTTRFNFRPSGLFANPPANDNNAINLTEWDFRYLPYGKDSIDVLVFDPPYMATPTCTKEYLNRLGENSGRPDTTDFDKKYRTFKTTGGMKHDDIMNLYHKGIREAKRVLKSGGMLWVKCKDQLEASKQRWSHIDIWTMSRRLGFIDKDLAILVPTSQINHPIRGQQRHMRKVHSYLWIFLKN
jgi:DNA methylase